MSEQFIFEEKRWTMFGETTFKYIIGNHGAKITIPSDTSITELPYHLEFETTEYSFGEKYRYPVKLPNVGLIVTKRCNGYGNGDSMSYIVRSIKNNTKNQVMKFTMSPVYHFDQVNKIAYCNTNIVVNVVQSKNKAGTWKLSGDKSRHMIYAIDFGYISKPEASFDK